MLISEKFSSVVLIYLTMFAILECGGAVSESGLDSSSQC